MNCKNVVLLFELQQALSRALRRPRAMSAPSITINSVKYATGDDTFAAASAVGGAPASDEYQDVAAAIRAGEKALFNAQDEYTEGPSFDDIGTVALRVPTANQLYQVDFTATYPSAATAGTGPSFFMSPNQAVPSTTSFATVAAATPTAAQIVDVDNTTSSHYYPPSITRLSATEYRVVLRLAASTATIAQRWADVGALSSMDDYYVMVMFEPGSASWEQYDTLEAAVAADPSLIAEDGGDGGEGGDEAGGPPSQATGMVVHTETDWRFIFSGGTGLMGVDARARGGDNNPVFRMFIPYALATWMGVDVTSDLTVYDEDLNVIADATPARVQGSDEDTVVTASRRGFLIDVPVSFDGSRSIGDLFEFDGTSFVLGSRSSGSQQVLFGSGGSVCFAKGTPIPMADGSRRSIELVLPGHRVRLADGTAAVVEMVEHTADVRLFEIAVSALGYRVPEMPLRVSAGHLLRLPSGLVCSAAELAELGLARVLPGRHTVYHLGFDDWGWLALDGSGLAAETAAWKPKHYRARPATDGVLSARKAEADRLGIRREAVLAAAR